MNRKNSISAIVIAKNEEKRIEKCLSALSWVDEIILVDNGSTDKTIYRSKKHNAMVVIDTIQDFSAMRNRGASVAKSDWLLYVDADEVVSEDLAREIRKVTNDPHASAYFISRRNFYLGHEWPTRDTMIRLIKKDALISWTGSLHEHPEIRGGVGELNEPFIHDTHRTLEEMVKKTNQWSDVEAALRFTDHHPSMVWWRFFHVMARAFWNSYVREKGWKAGTMGLVESMYQAFSMFITYAKLWEKQQTRQS